MAAVINASAVFSQSKSKTLQVEVTRTNNIAIFTTAPYVDYEGYNGKTIIVSNEETNRSNSQDTKDLPGELNYEKTTGNNNDLRIKITGTSKHLKIKVPNNLYLLTIEARCINGKTNLDIKQYNGRLIVHALMDSTHISQLTAPFSIYSERGVIIADHIHWQQHGGWNFDSPSPQFTFPYMISSKKGDITIFLADSLKASLKLSAIKGGVYSNIKMQHAMMNGGGVAIYVRSDFGNIFLKQE